MTTTKRFAVVSSDGVCWSKHTTRELAEKMMGRWIKGCQENPELRALTFAVAEAQVPTEDIPDGGTESRVTFFAAREAASALGRMGGKASAKALTPAKRRARAKRAGKASAASLTPEQRQERARAAGNARWAKARARELACERPGCCHEKVEHADGPCRKSGCRCRGYYLGPAI